MDCHDKNPNSMSNIVVQYTINDLNVTISSENYIKTTKG